MNDATLVLIGTLLGAAIGALGAGGASYLNARLQADHEREESARARRAEIRRESVRQAKRALGEVVYMARPRTIGSAEWPTDRMKSKDEVAAEWERLRAGWPWQKERVEELQREAGIALAMLASKEIAAAADEFWAALTLYKVEDSILFESLDPTFRDPGAGIDDDAVDKALEQKREASGFLERAHLEVMNALDEFVAQ